MSEENSWSDRLKSDYKTKTKKFKSLGKTTLLVYLYPKTTYLMLFEVRKMISDLKIFNGWMWIWMAKKLEKVNLSNMSSFIFSPLSNVRIRDFFQFIVLNEIFLSTSFRIRAKIKWATVIKLTLAFFNFFIQFLQGVGILIFYSIIMFAVRISIPAWCVLKLRKFAQVKLGQSPNKKF